MCSFSYILWIIFIVNSTANGIVNITNIDREISMEAFVESIRDTIKWCRRTNNNAITTYKKVFGPDDEMNGIYIGELVLRINYLSIIDVHKYHFGMQYLHLKIFETQQLAHILWMQPIHNGLSRSQLMRFSNALMSRLKVYTAYLMDTAHIKYVGCELRLQQLQLIDFYAIRGFTYPWADLFGFYSPYPHDITTEMRAIFDWTLVPNNYSFFGLEIEIDKPTKIVPILNYYWHNDKCIFSKIHHGLMRMGGFNRLHYLNGPSFLKRKLFVYPT